MGRLKRFLNKKVKGASLVEALISSILIMIVFGISMVTIGNVLERTVKSNTRSIDNELIRLEYLYQNGKIQIPDVLEKEQWQIEIEREQENDLKYVVFTAKNKQSQKEKRRRILE
jgi:hypothetical protein